MKWRRRKAADTGKRNIVAGALLLLCAVCTGCGSSVEPSELSSEQIQTEASGAADAIAVTVVNESGMYIREVIFTVPEDEAYDGYGALGDIDGLDPGTTYEAEIPASGLPFQIEAYDLNWEKLYEGSLQETVEDGSVIVLLPENNGTQMVYEPGTDADTAAEEAKLAYGMAVAADQEETEQREIEAENQDAADTDSATKAAQAMGYDSVANMRFYTHEGYNRDDAQFPMLTGYWYPGGDENSLTYFAMDNRDNMRWYRFDEKEGDVETEVDGIRSKVLDTYTLNSGKKFTMKHDTIVFEGEDVEYRMGTY